MIFSILLLGSARSLLYKVVLISQTCELFCKMAVSNFQPVLFKSFFLFFTRKTINFIFLHINKFTMLVYIY